MECRHAGDHRRSHRPAHHDEQPRPVGQVQRRRRLRGRRLLRTGRRKLARPDVRTVRGQGRGHRQGTDRGRGSDWRPGRPHEPHPVRMDPVY